MQEPDEDQSKGIAVAAQQALTITPRTAKILAPDGEPISETSTGALGLREADEYRADEARSANLCQRLSMLYSPLLIARSAGNLPAPSSGGDPPRSTSTGSCEVGGSSSKGSLISRRYEVRLRKLERLETLEETARYIRREHSDDRIEGHETLIQYCLFARHRDTGLPILAHMGYRKTGYYDYFIEKLSVALGGYFGTDDFRILFEIVCAYVEEKAAQVNFPGENPTDGLMPATAFLFLANMRSTYYASWVPDAAVGDDQNLPGIPESLAAAWKKCGRLLAPADTPDEFGETQLSRLLQASPWLFGVSGASAAAAGPLMEAFMEHVPRARDAVNVKCPVHGGTAAHTAVRVGAPADVLRVLIDYGADLTIKDNKRRTALDLAKIYRSDDGVLHLLMNATNDSAEEPQDPLREAWSPLLDFSNGRQLECFPRIYLPSDPDLKPSRTNEVMVEYLRRELPQLLAIDPSLVVVPPLVDICPYPYGSSAAKGWNTEQKALKAVVPALKQLRQENPSLHIACFHGLRYGSSLPGRVQWESDFDIAVFCYDMMTGIHFVMLFEVKSITRAKDVVRAPHEDGREAQTMGTHALDQLCKHIGSFEHHVGINPSPEWVIPCLVLPLFPISSRGETCNEDSTNSENVEVTLKRNWDDFMRRATNSADARVAQYAKIDPMLLTRSTLENSDAMKTLFENIFKSISDASVVLDINKKKKWRADYSTLLAWCVAHCMGIVVQHVSQVMDEQTAEDIQEQLALFTVEQRRAYELVPSSYSDPCLIVGAAGTGKTLLAVQKLIKCEKDGLINEKHSGIFLTHERNEGLMALVQRQLKTSSTNYIVVKPIKAASVLEVLNGMKDNANDARQFRYVVLDQLEDMFEPAMPESLAAELLRAILQIKSLEMFWVTINPFEVPKRHSNTFAAYLNSKANSACCVRLDTRIRNTTEIGQTMDRAINFNFTGQFLAPLRHFQPEPACWTSITTSGRAACAVFSKFYKADGSWLFGQASLAEVLHHMLLNASLKNCQMMVITVNISPNEVREADKHLIKAFCRTAKNKKLPSTAPLLVPAVLVGKIKESLDDSELERVQEELKRSFSVALNFESASAPSSRDLLLQCFRQCAESYNVREMEEYDQRKVEEEAHLGEDEGSLPLWDDSEDEYCGSLTLPELFKSVAFQATLSLVNRFINWAEVNGNEAASQQHFHELHGALFAGTTDKLRNLILAHRCISVLDRSNVGGYEADAVVIWYNNQFVFSRFYDERLSSLIARAKVMAVVLVQNASKRAVEAAFPTMIPLIH